MWPSVFTLPSATCQTFNLRHVWCLQGPFDVAVFNAVFGNLHDQHESLARICFLLRPGRWAPATIPLPAQIGSMDCKRIICLSLPSLRESSPCCTYTPACFGPLPPCPSHPLPSRLPTQPPACSHVVISHPLGCPWLQRFREQQPELVPHELPDVSAGFELWLDHWLGCWLGC